MQILKPPSKAADSKNGINHYRSSHFAPAFFFLEPSRRRALKLLYAVCRVLDDAVDKPTGHPEEFLEAWRQVFQSDDSRFVEPYGHGQLAADFLMVSKIYDIPSFILLDLINNGVAVDLVTKRFPTPMDTESYCYGVAGTVGLACLPIFGVPLERAREFAVRLGIAVQWTNLIRDVGTDAKMDRIYLPLDHLERFGCAERDLIAGVSSPAFLALMDYEAKIAESHYRRAFDLLPKEWEKELRPARVMAKIYLKLLEKLRAQGYPVFEKRVSLNVFEKSYATWKALRTS